MDYLKYINSLEILRFGVLNKNLPFVDEISTNINISNSYYEHMPNVHNILVTEFLRTLEKAFLNVKSKDDYINLIGLDEHNLYLRILRYVLDNRFDFIVCSSKISGLFNFSMEFNPIYKRDLRNINIEKVGDIFGVDVLLNPNLSWNDDYILCGYKDMFEYNISDINSIQKDNCIYSAVKYNIKNRENYRFESTKYSERLEYVRNTGFTCLYLIDNFDSKYKNFLRDERINDLLK